MSTGVRMNVLIAWIDDEVRELWGVKAAVRALGIATHGWDVEPVGAYDKAETQRDQDY
jgi:hypothetical protein